MKINSITVHAGRTFNDPFESYSNFKPGISIDAGIADGEDAEAAIKALQAKAERLMDDHKNLILKTLQEIQEMTALQREVHDLESTIRRGQSRLDDLRKNKPHVFQALPLSTEPRDSNDVQF